MTLATATDLPERLRHRMVDQLIEGNYLKGSQWEGAFRAVPRETFVDRFIVLARGGEHPSYDLTDTSQREAAMTAVYSDNPLITQQDRAGTATSSSTAPSLMALMLEALRVAPGMSVLEIGTGTGYNAAILSHALSDQAVTSVDIDPALTASARDALSRAGYHPKLVCADGSNGDPEGASYDRLIATCSVTRVPASWVNQVKAGGTLLVNVGFGMARLEVSETGSASGRFLDFSSFMRIRSDVNAVTATAHEVLALARPESPACPEVFIDALEEKVVVFLRSVMMKDVIQVTEFRPGGPEYVLADPASGSWARARPSGSSTSSVIQGGPRRLWNELMAIVSGWVYAGKPPITAYGLTVTKDGQQELWLD